MLMYGKTNFPLVTSIRTVGYPTRHFLISIQIWVPHHLSLDVVTTHPPSFHINKRAVPNSCVRESHRGTEAPIEHHWQISGRFYSSFDPYSVMLKQITERVCRQSSYELKLLRDLVKDSLLLVDRDTRGGCLNLKRCNLHLREGLSIM